MARFLHFSIASGKNVRIVTKCKVTSDFLLMCLGPHSGAWSFYRVKLQQNSFLVTVLRDTGARGVSIGKLMRKKSSMPLLWNPEVFTLSMWTWERTCIHFVSEQNPSHWTSRRIQFRCFKISIKELDYLSYAMFVLVFLVYSFSPKAWAFFQGTVFFLILIKAQDK